MAKSTLDDDQFLQTQFTQHSQVFSNSLCFFSIKVNQPQNIYKNSKDITGVITFTPKVPMLNIPIQLTILGESQCTLFEETFNEQSFLVKDSFSASKSFRIHQTQEQLVQRKNEAQKCLQSSEFLSQAYTQNSKQTIEQTNREIFLEGKQQLFQTNNDNSNPDQIQKKLKVLSPNTKYQYEFSFFLPNNVPISVNDKIFPGVQLFVGYKIQAAFDLDEKFMLCEENMKAKYLKHGKRVSVFSEFNIKRVTSDPEDETVANKLTFKYFNSQGTIENNEPSLTSCITRCFCPRIWRQRYCYDLYHCELLTSIDNLRILHLTVRIFLEPDKDRIDVRKVKKGKLYMTNKKSDPEDLEQKPRNKSEMTNSKIMPEKEGNMIRINEVKVRFYGEIVNIKKLMIFQKAIELNRQNYDAVEGELILEMMDSYFSEKNELFEIRYWFEIEPIPYCQNQRDQSVEEKPQNGSPAKKQASNEFDITFSKLVDKRQGKNHEDKVEKLDARAEKIKKVINAKIQTVSSEHHYIRI